jgi:hypothetical protein
MGEIRPTSATPTRARETKQNHQQAQNGEHIETKRDGIVGNGFTETDRRRFPQSSYLPAAKILAPEARRPFVSAQ